MIVIHCEPRIAWQGPAAEKFYRGLQALDLDCEITHSRHRLGGDVTPVLLGTTCWRDVEASGGDYLLVDRCSFGHGADAVTLVWNGHGRRGDHRVPEDYDASRWEAQEIALSPWQRGNKRVLCGQTEPYSPHWSCMENWYKTAFATHFRPHPAGSANTLQLPVWQYWDGVGKAITLNSSVAVDAIIRGVPTEVHDEGGMAYPGFEYGDDREPWLHWLAWTQWSWDEIEAGEPIEHLFDG